MLAPSAAPLYRAALQLLGIENFVLAIHDASQPAAPDDLGRGTSYSSAAAQLFEYASALGFNGIQMGPQGQTSDINASPYDGTLFARNVMNIPLSTLVREGLLSDAEASTLLAEVRPSASRSCAYGPAYRLYQSALQRAFAQFQAQKSEGQARALSSALGEFWKVNEAWLSPASLYGPLCQLHGHGDWRRWGGGFDAHLDQRLSAPKASEEALVRARIDELKTRFALEREAYAFSQMLVHQEHEALRLRTQQWGLKLFGDLQVGFSGVDTWAHRAFILEAYRVGAPPSRTNPEGQPWDYPVLNPQQYRQATGELGGALRLLERRMLKMLHEYDGVRLDHPHGFVCPWVYQKEDPDPLHAVQTGARLFDSPDFPEHPLLATYAIARADQINRHVAPYADGWVTSLDDSQVAQYSAQFDVIVGAAQKKGRALSDLVCEVLSTQPYPLQRVLERFGLGRFRVTQKADLNNPEDPYRSENAKPQDWIMVGTHDTPPLWRLLPQWRQSGALSQQASYLAKRLTPQGQSQEAFAQRLAEDERLLAQAKFADIFASKAQNVMVFFADLFGLTDVYNSPGTVQPGNWMLRVPPDWATAYPRMAKTNEALNLPRVLSMALRARGLTRNDSERQLVQRLEERV